MTKKQKVQITKMQKQTRILKKVVRGVEKFKRGKITEQEQKQAELKLQKDLKNLKDA